MYGEFAGDRCVRRARKTVAGESGGGVGRGETGAICNRAADDDDVGEKKGGGSRVI